MRWTLDQLKTAHPDAPEELLRQYVTSRDRKMTASKQVEAARRKIEATTGKPFGKCASRRP